MSSNNTESNTISKICDEDSYSIHIIHRDKNYEVKFLDFSTKSSYKEVIGLPHSFKITVDDILETDSVDALIQHIKTRKTKEVVNEHNILDLNFLAHLYGFYLLQAITGPFLLSKIPVNRVFEAFENRKNVDGYIQSFSYYLTHNFDTFVRDPSFYTLPFSVIEKMLDFNAPELTADDIVQFTINTYYIHGKKSLTLLEKANNCKSISNQQNQQNVQASSGVYNQVQSQDSKSKLRNIFYKMIDSEDKSNSNANPSDQSNDSDNFIQSLNNSNTNNNFTIDSSSGSFNFANNNDNNDNDAPPNNTFNFANNNKNNFSVNSDIYKKKVVIHSKKSKPKRGGKILEKECSTSSLIRLYATICHEHPYPYTQYICNILSKRKKTTTNEDTVRQEVEELRYNISSVYISLLETTQGNKSAAYILLTSLFESGKIDFMKNSDIINLYKNLADIPAPQDETPLISTSKNLRFSFSFEELENSVTNFDKRMLLKKFDWGAHGLYMLYRIHQEGLYGSPKDPSKAQLFLKKSVDRGYSEAYFKMASFIVTSQNFLSIKEDKLEVLRKAADLGNGDYQFAYACCLVERTDKYKDPITAAHYFKLAMLSGHPNGQMNYEKFQCNVSPVLMHECSRLYSIATSEKVENLRVKLNMLRKIADCGFEPAIILYPTLLAEADCSLLNPDRPMDEEMQKREVCHYFRYAIKKSMKWCHSVLALFLLRKCKKLSDVTLALNVLFEGSSRNLPDASVVYARLILRILGRSYRQVDAAIAILQTHALNNYVPALLELASSFLHGDEIERLFGPDGRIAMGALNQLYQLKEPIGSSRLLYIMINDRGEPRNLTVSRIGELKSIVDATINNKKKRGPLDFLPLWLYAKVMLEGKVTDTDFKSAVSALKKADDFAPAMVLLVSLCFQFSGIVKTGFNFFNRALFSFGSSSKASDTPAPILPKNFDSALLPLPSAATDIIERFSDKRDPTFMYKMGSIALDEDDNSERGFQLIRQSADAGSICGMMRYAMMRIEGLFRPRNEYEAIKMFRKSSEMGLDSAVIQYARYAMKYEELRKEALQALQLIRTSDSSQTAASRSNKVNFVARRKIDGFEGIKLRLALGKCLCLQGGSLLQESQYHLTSLIQTYERQSEQKSDTQISKDEYAESLFYYAKTLEKTALSLTPADPCINGSLVHFLKSYANGYKPAAENYVSLLMRLGLFENAVNFLLDNLSKSTFALYKIGSLTIFETPGVTTNIAESQAVDFIKLATMLDDSRQFPDAFWRLGTMLRDGYYVAKDEKKALDCFYEAAELGCVHAVVAIGDAAMKEALRAYERSKGSEKSIEMLSICRQNRMVAFQCFANASTVDSPSGHWCEAMCLLNGIGLEKDVPAAVMTLRYLADRGDRDAIYKLGKIAFNASMGALKSPALFSIGIRFIASAAQLGHSTALWRLGLLILQGKIEKNAALNIFNNDFGFNFLNASSEKVAAELFKRSADRGNLRGASLFSLCLENGIGVDKNMDLARLYASSRTMEKKS